MYAIIRRIHLFTGLALLLFVIMYFITGYMLVHEAWLPPAEPKKSSRSVSIEYQGQLDSTEFTSYLEKKFGLRGSRSKPKHREDGTWEFEWFHPGTLYKAIIATNGKSATITTSDLGKVRIGYGLHRLHGYGGGWLYNVWAVIVDFSSLALIGFSISGIYLWHQSTKKRLPGWVCLAASFGFTTITVVYFLTAR